MRAERATQAEILRLAAHWADQHPDTSTGGVGGMRLVGKGEERGVRFGGEGTARVREFAPAELAVSLEIHPLACRSLMADALDLRDRMPGLWQVVQELGMPAWVARKAASVARKLSAAQATWVDDELVGRVELPPSRFLAVAEALVVAAAPEDAEAERRDARRSRFVTISEHQRVPGSSGVYATIGSEAARVLGETVDRLADLLQQAAPQPAEGERAPDRDLWRAQALEMLGNPALALRHLLDPDTDADATAADPVDDAADLAAAIRAVPVSALAPRAVLYLHLTDRSLCTGEGVARVEGSRPITTATAVELLGHHQVTVTEVIDLADRLPADAYEFTGIRRERVGLRTPADCYPYAVRVGHRRGSVATGSSVAGEGRIPEASDVDHTESYDPHGPPGQTGAGNAGPMTRHHHRIKTHGPMSVRQPRPGLYVWRTPHERYRVTDHRGTRWIDPALGSVIHATDCEVEQHLATLIIDAT